MEQHVLRCDAEGGITGSGARTISRFSLCA